MMKSTDIKNWRNELSYKEMVLLDDFHKILSEAIACDSCLLCGSHRILNDGLCLNCSMHTKDVERKFSDFFLKHNKVQIKITLPNKLPIK